MAGFSPIFSAAAHAECVATLMVLSNSASDDSQEVSVMALAAHTDVNRSGQSTNDVFLSAITYHTVSLVNTQCGRNSQTLQDENNISANSACLRQNNPRPYGYKSHSVEQNLSMMHSCKLHGKYRD